MKNVPNWKDINPRLGVSYDLFGNGRTAVKATVGRYISGGSLASNVNPVNTSVNSATRSWTDTNGNFYPDCDWSNPALNNECGPLSNLNFGKVNPTATQFDKEVLEGWGVRPYNWSVSAGVQHQISQRASIDVGYFRRWYGNFSVVDNQLVGPEDYDPFCVTAPRNDSRLPNAGEQICGFYDIKPAKNGLSQNLVRLAKHYGEQTEIYNGVDASMTWRLRGLTLFGGLSTGRTTTSQCFVVDVPALYLSRGQPGDGDGGERAESDVQLQRRAAVPDAVQGVRRVSAAVGHEPQRHVPGGPAACRAGALTSITADYVATNAEIRPTLNRDLAAGANGTATRRTAQAIRPARRTHQAARSAHRQDRSPSAGARRVRLSLDIYNVLNSNDWQTIHDEAQLECGGQPVAAADADPAGAVFPGRDADRLLAVCDVGRVPRRGLAHVGRLTRRGPAEVDRRNISNRSWLAQEVCMRKTGLLVAVVGILLTAVAPLVAHHAFSAEFDQSKPIKMSGEITKLEWTNPHAWLHINVKEPDGKVVLWRFEMGAPNALLRAGWSREDIKPGTAVTISGFLAGRAARSVTHFRSGCPMARSVCGLVAQRRPEMNSRDLCLECLKCLRVPGVSAVLGAKGVAREKARCRRRYGCRGRCRLAHSARAGRGSVIGKRSEASPGRCQAIAGWDA